jgi:hypothetical protein
LPNFDLTKLNSASSERLLSVEGTTISSAIVAQLIIP